MSRGRFVVVFLITTLAACGGGTGASGHPTGSSSASGSSPSPSPSPSLTTDTTADVDGVEPDAVEPPPNDGVPSTAVAAVTSTRTPLPGFGEVVVEVRRRDGAVLEWCLLLAETSAQTQRGLMEVTDADLGGYDGMLFRFAAVHDGGFYMRNTPQPLDIAYLDEDGSIVSVERMEPCSDVDGCPTYPSGGEFRRAIEVPVAAGGVAELGIEAGAEVVDTGRTCA